MFAYSVQRGQAQAFRLHGPRSRWTNAEQRRSADDRLRWPRHLWGRALRPRAAQVTESALQASRTVVSMATAPDGDRVWGRGGSGLTLPIFHKNCAPASTGAQFSRIHAQISLSTRTRWGAFKKGSKKSPSELSKRPPGGPRGAPKKPPRAPKKPPRGPQEAPRSLLDAPESPPKGP